MRENERRRILDEVAEAVHRGAPLDSYQDQIDRLVDEAEMSLDTIEAEVNDRISRIQTDEEIDNLRSSVKKKGLLIGGATAVVLFLLSLAGSYLLMQTVLPTPEPPPIPTATPAPTAIAAHSVGHWLFSIETREVQPTAGDPTQAIVTVHVIDKDGKPAPDGLEAVFSVTSGDITPRTSTVRNGMLSALYTATPGAPPATLMLTVQNDTVSYQMPAFGPVEVAQEQTPVQSPTPEETPSPTPITPTPIPVSIVMDWRPRWSEIIDVGVGQSAVITITARQGDKPASNALVTLIAQTDVVTISPVEAIDGIPVTDSGIVTFTLTATDTPVQDAAVTAGLSDSNETVTHSLIIRPMVEISIDLVNLRSTPVLPTDDPNTTAKESDANVIMKARRGEKFVVEGKNKTWWLIRLPDGSKLWVDDSVTVEKTANLDVAEVASDAAVLVIPTRAPIAQESGTSVTLEPEVTVRKTLQLSPEDKASGIRFISVFMDSSESTLLAEMPEGVEVEASDSPSELDLLQVQLVLWVSQNNVDGDKPGLQLTNASNETRACGYQVGKPPESDDDKYCGTLKVFTSAMPFARLLDATEEADEKSLGSESWKLAVIDAWVRRDNLK